ncbi:replication-associated recombination protein A [Pendulispora rubella]|uniref:Replication-associated recombination protein A n=1 Tax=Pendulispora rubella TaxID=2741070 RepID=A0ABZ2L638_9BACT
MASRARGSHSGGETLFGAAARRDPSAKGHVPLAERMRPHRLEELVGQAHLFGPNKLLTRAIAGDRLPSMILWGPPGVGKTTLGRIVAEGTKAEFVLFSAVLGSLADLRQIVGEARERLDYHGKRTIVFVDEIHRFNKAQQDAFLPHVEAGTITLIGATTENPSFAVNAALLSRCKVFRLETLDEKELTSLLERALADEARGLGARKVRATPDALTAIARLARGDARRALTTLETTVDYLDTAGEQELTADAVIAGQSHDPLLYDKAGEEHYNVVSAFIKSMRGSDPDAAVYWMMRMLDAGDDPLFVLRRMLIFASEDVGNADPRALMVVEAADCAFRRIGMPEGLYAMAQAATYLAATVKSNAAGKAWQRARALIEQHGALPVPKKLRNAVTSLMKNEGYGQGYKYAHDFEGGVVPGETYLPDALVGEAIYEPADRGEEARIRTRIEGLRAAVQEKKE